MIAFGWFGRGFGIDFYRFILNYVLKSGFKVDFLPVWHRFWNGFWRLVLNYVFKMGFKSDRFLLVWYWFLDRVLTIRIELRVENGVENCTLFDGLAPVSGSAFGDSY